MTKSLDSASFEIRQCLGAGGFGEVYLAALDGYGDVALKVLHNGLDPRSQAVQRLRDEARLLGLLDHPSILSIHDLMLLDGRVALVTEYIDGQDLEQLLVAKPGIDLPAGLEVLGHVASALQSAFTTIGPKGTPLGLLHRDIKPGNIRVGRDGSVKLLDFGIAKATGVTREAKTRTSGVLGSFAYMAPERFDPKQTDTPAGDVCSLGCVLFELLSGGEMLFGEYDIKDLFGLALMPERREEALKEKLGTLEVAPALMDLLSEMLAHEPLDRPALADLPDRLDALAGEVQGQRLLPWSQDYRWPMAPHLPGGLTGRTLTGSSLTNETKAPADATLAPPPAPDTTGVQEGKPAPMPLVPSPDPGTSAEATFAFPKTEAPPDPSATAPASAVPSLELEKRPTPPEPPAPAPPPPPAVTAASISPSSEVDAIDAPVQKRGVPWVLIGVAAVVVLLLGIGGGIAGAAGLGLLLTNSEVDPIDPVDPVDPLPVVEPGPAPVDPDPQVDPVPVPVPTDPVPGQPDPVVDPDPTGPDVADPIDPAPVPTPNAATGIDACGDLVSLEPNALAGRLPADTSSCLAGLMLDARLKQTDRNKVGRVVLSDARVRCDAGGDCARFERLQRQFFAEVTRSDASMLAAFAEFLFRTAENRQARLSEVDDWAERALERRDQWSGRQYAKLVERMREIQARAAYQRFTLEPSASNRQKAFERSAEWAEQRRSFGLDASTAMELCASAAGSGDRCDRRVSTEIATESIRFVSRPFGAAVRVDGAAVGDTPVSVELTHGSHTVEIELDGTSSQREILVGGGEATQWSWVSGTDTWAPVHN